MAVAWHPPAMAWHRLAMVWHPLAMVLYPLSMSQCWLQGNMRLPTSSCPPAFSLLLHLHVSLSPSPATTANVSLLSSKNNPLAEDNLPRAALPH